MATSTCWRTLENNAQCADICTYEQVCVAVQMLSYGWCLLVIDQSIIDETNHLHVHIMAHSSTTRGLAQWAPRQRPSVILGAPLAEPHPMPLRPWSLGLAASPTHAMQRPGEPYLFCCKHMQQNRYGFGGCCKHMQQNSNFV